jgi:hypothetical protein
VNERVLHHDGNRHGVTAALAPISFITAQRTTVVLATAYAEKRPDLWERTPPRPWQHTIALIGDV